MLTLNVMSNIKETYHPNAYLNRIKNVKVGLEARTKILKMLDQQPFSAPVLARNVSLSYKVVLYHLHLLEAELVVGRRGTRPRIWVITGIGQTRLAD
jgi:predicted transcriptional regulator